MLNVHEALAPITDDTGVDGFALDASRRWCFDSQLAPLASGGVILLARLSSVSRRQMKEQTSSRGPVGANLVSICRERTGQLSFEVSPRSYSAPMRTSRIVLGHCQVAGQQVA